MESKKCAKCCSLKLKIDFYKMSSSADGLAGYCKDCDKEIHRGYKEDKKTDRKVFLQLMYKRMSQRAKGFDNKSKASGKGLIASKDFYDFALSDDNFNFLYEQWAKADFNFHIVPSIDRINNNIGYIKGNIQFLTYIENIRKPKGKRR